MERPEAPVTGERRGPSTAAWVGAVALWVLISVPNGLRNSDEGAGYAIGSVVGGLIGTLLLALLMRFLYVRFAARHRELWMPSVFVTAAVIALVVALGRAAGDTGDRGAGEGRGDVGSAEDLMVELPASLRYGPVPGANRQQIVASFRREVGEDSEIELRGIRADDGAMGLAIGIFADDPGTLTEFEAGFESTGGMLEPEQIQGTDFRVGADRNGNSVAVRARGDNGLVLLLAASEPEVRAFAQPFAGD